MKIPIRLVLWLSGIAAGSASAAPLSEGELTKVINDVKVLPVEASPIAATPGARISGRTAVSTGVQSRAELRFSDNTLTRMGANSIFRMDQSTRTVDLQKGVILLQVPKQMGGATVRTAAVTAAVTGTTVMFEYTADGYIKIIVIEGEVDVTLNKDKSKFRTLKAGDMWITRADDDKNLPLPVQVDLARLQRTSKLLNTDEFAPLGNERYVKGALKDQGDKKSKGELLDTSFQIQGRGRNVTLLLADHEHIGGKPPAPKPPIPPPNKAINIQGSTVFENQSTIDTAGPSNAYNSVVGGFAPLAGNQYTPGQDEVFGKYMFDQPKAFPGLDDVLAGEGSWSVLKGDEFYIAGSPAVDSTVGTRNVILGATGDINFTDTPPFQASLATSGQWTLDDATHALVFTSLVGSINFDSFSLVGSTQVVEFYANGRSSDVNIISPESSRIFLPQGNFTAVAGRDVRISGASIDAKTVALSAGRNLGIKGKSKLTTSESIILRAKMGVKVNNSSELRSLSQLGDARILIDARDGKVEVAENSTVEADVVSLASHHGDVSLMNSTISAREIKGRVFDGGGVLLISNAILGHGGNASDLIRLYGEGSQGIRFVGDTTLRGGRVDIAGPSVTIDSGSQVRLSNPGGTNVFANSHFYNNGINGIFTAIDSPPGSGTAVQVNQQPYANRPKF
jgi:hypothetical protein